MEGLPPPGISYSILPKSGLNRPLKGADNKWSSVFSTTEGRAWRASSYECAAVQSMHVHVRPECEQSSLGRRSPQRRLGARKGEQPMTSGRLVLAAAAHHVTAISLAFWLNHRAKKVALVAIPSPLAKALPGTAAAATPTLCTSGISGGAELHEYALRTERTPASPIAPQELARPGLSVFRGVSHPSSSGSEQIPLLVGRAGELQTELGHTEIHTSRWRFRAKSLNPNLSLERRAA
jgi:hypothetical protein